MPAPSRQTVGFVLKGYPRLSETFIAQEIRWLEARGLNIRIISLRHPTEPDVHPVHREIAAPVRYLPEYLHDEPVRVWRAWRRQRRRPGYARARRLWLRDLARDRTPNRIRRFGQALVLADEMAGEIDALHAHFLHTPASVARYAAALLGLPWSVSAHAKDIWTTPLWEKREKIAEAGWLTTCSAEAAAHLRAIAAPERHERIQLAFHGLDLGRFPPPPARETGPDGHDPNAPVRLLSVGRAVAKKGYRVLLSALAMLPADLAWRLDHIGAGPDLKRLRRQAARLGLDGRIVWHGAQPQESVLAAYREADLFVLASRKTRSGDQDGLPNVLLEAQSQALACIASDIAGVPELIRDGESGVLVPPDDPATLAGALACLIADPARRDRLGRAGRDIVVARFDHEACLSPLAERFGLAAPTSQREVA